MMRDFNNILASHGRTIASSHCPETTGSFSAKSPNIKYFLDRTNAACSAFGACVMLSMTLALGLVLTGCGSGGYAGDGITSLSSTAITIDAGQSFQFTAALAVNAPVTWSLTSDACSSTACGSLSALSGPMATYNAPTGISSQLKVNLTATLVGTKSSAHASITVNPDPVISGSLPSGTVGSAYSATLTASGGTAPLKLSLTALPAGLTFNATTGVISGTPTTAGAFAFGAQAVDSSDIPYTVKAPESIEIMAPAATPVLVSGAPSAGTVAVAYSTAFSATGGTAPYTWSVATGTLPAGLTLSTAGVVMGTPTTQGTSTFTVQAQDSLGSIGSGLFSIIISPAANNKTLALSPLPGATVGVPYSATVIVTGGTAPYGCTQTAGSLPVGLTLAANCLVSGTPTTPGTSNFTVKATDSSSPAASTSGPESITVSPAGSLVLANPPNGTVGTPYNGTIGVSGGTAPYSCAITTGALPAGLTLNAGCVITGTPTTAGTAMVTVNATDSSSPVKTVSGPVSLSISPSALTLALSGLPGATVGVPYSATIGVSGGTAPYSCIQTGGSLPAGLSLSTACVVSGTPTLAGTASVTVKVTDVSNPVETITAPESITVVAAGILALGNPPSGTVGTPYTGTIGVSGGTAPYSCVITAGVLPAGLTLGAGCVVSGTPTAAGTATVTVKGTDSGTPVKTGTGPVTLIVSSRCFDADLTEPARSDGRRTLFRHHRCIGRNRALQLRSGWRLPAGRTQLIRDLRGERHAHHGGDSECNRQGYRLNQPGGNRHRTGKHCGFAGAAEPDHVDSARRHSRHPL